MGFKNLVENHPIVVLAGVAVAAGSIVAEAVSYLSGAKYEIERRTVAFHNQRRIDDLEMRLVSVERKVGGTETFFDITKILRPAAAIRALPEKYLSFADEKFFVAVPITEPWKYSEATELALLMETIGGSQEALAPLVAALEASPVVHLWRGQATYTTELEPKNQFKGLGVPEKFSFFPYIAVQVLTEEDFRRMGAALDVFEEEKQVEIEAILAGLEKLGEDLEGEGDEGADEESVEEGVESTRIRAEELMSEIFRGDLVAVMLGGIVQSMTSLPLAYKNASVSINSAQKKGVVMYLQAVARFETVAIKEKPEAARLYVFQEWFLVSGSNYVIVVKCQIPSSDSRAPELSWVSQWLAGLKIPATLGA